MRDFQISKHAVEQYRTRVVACPERTRSDDDLRRSIRWQLEQFPMQMIDKALVISAGPWRQKKRKPWEMALHYTTHMFVIDGGSVVTTLGFMMRPKKATSIRARARRQALAQDRIAALPPILLRP